MKQQKQQQKQQKWQSRAKYQLVGPLLSFYLNRIRKKGGFEVSHEERLQALIDQRQPCIPCYWHHQSLSCGSFLVAQKAKGFNPGFLVSPSHDGDAPARILHSWGATVIRGSSSRTGAEAMRELYQLVKKDQTSPGITPDGPRGPALEFKPGPILLAQMLQVPILPIAGMPEKYWRLNSWDRFVMPKPGSSYRVAIGEPIYIEKGRSLEQLEPTRRALQETLVYLTDSVSGQAITTGHQQSGSNN